MNEERILSIIFEKGSEKETLNNIKIKNIKARNIQISSDIDSANKKEFILLSRKK